MEKQKKIPTRVKRDYIKMMLTTNDKWLAGALIKIFNMQTREEKSSESTSEDNGIGFTGVDAYILTSFSKQLLGKGTLSKKQVDMLRKKMPKYWAQIYRISDKDKMDPLIEEYANKVGVQTQLKLKLNTNV
jgi:hypothetical protein